MIEGWGEEECNCEEAESWAEEDDDYEEVEEFEIADLEPGAGPA